MLPGFVFGTWDIAAGPSPSVADDPSRAWRAVDDAIQAALDQPEIAGRSRETPMGETTFEDAIDQICTPDVLVHTWDLARATGLAETLDAEEVHRFVAGMEAADAAMRASGHYGPRVEVPADADEQTRLIAFVGRQP